MYIVHMALSLASRRLLPGSHLGWVGPATVACNKCISMIPQLMEKHFTGCASGAQSIHRSKLTSGNINCLGRWKTGGWGWGKVSSYAGTQKSPNRTEGFMLITFSGGVRMNHKSMDWVGWIFMRFITVVGAPPPGSIKLVFIFHSFV